jgi:hypothetical protein
MTDNNSSKTISDFADVDRSMLKIAVLAILSMASISSFGYFLKLFFQGTGSDAPLISGLSVVLFLIIFVLQTLFIKSFKVNALIIFLDCAGLSAAFYNIPSAILIGIALVFTALFFGNLNGVRELKNSLKINFWKASKTILPKAIAAIFLFISIVYVYGDTIKKDFFLSGSDFEKIIFSPSILLAQKFFPQFNLNSSLTFEELVIIIAKKQVEENPQLNILPKTVKNLIVNQTAKEIREQVAGFVGVTVKSNSKISDFVYEALKEKFGALPENLKSFVLVGVVLIIFLTLEILALPVRLIISFLAFIVYELLLAFGFATIELEGRSKEIIILK